VQKVDLQTVENSVGFPQRKFAPSFQYVVQMGLGDSGTAGKSALGRCAAPHPLTKFIEETLLQVVEGHCFGLRTISHRNRVLVKVPITTGITIRNNS
jgi:hypothetical protein